MSSRKTRAPPCCSGGRESQLRKGGPAGRGCRPGHGHLAGFAVPPQRPRRNPQQRLRTQDAIVFASIQHVAQEGFC